MSRTLNSLTSCFPIRGLWSALTGEDFTSKPSNPKSCCTGCAQESRVNRYSLGIPRGLKGHWSLSRGANSPAYHCSIYLISHRLSDHYAFIKPNDRRALDLMNAAAVEVMKDLPDLCIAYGVSDEYRFVLSFFSSSFSQHSFLTLIFQLCLPPKLSALRKTKCVS